MILSYRDKRTRDFAAGNRVKAFSGIQRAAQLKLDRLEAATSRQDLAALPGNRFEALGGDRKVSTASASTTSGGSAFVWTDSGPEEVEIVDYH
jgi:proteic killer suppression protein